MSETPHRYRAARKLADAAEGEEDLSAIEGALMYAASDPPPNPSEMTEMTPDVASEDLYREVLYHLEEAGIPVEDGDAVADIRLIFDAARVLVERGSIPENEVVANVPFNEDEVTDAVGSLVVNLLDLLQEADSEIVILNPFFTREGYEKVDSQIINATKRGVKVIVVTKSLTYGDSTQNEWAMNQLFGEGDLVSENLELYEYVLDDDKGADYPATIHSKVTVSDGERAYLGTANMTHRGLVENFEVGVIFEDNTVKILRELVGDLLSSDYIYRVEHTPSGLERR